jgi:hypothetical protein
VIIGVISPLDKGNKMTLEEVIAFFGSSYALKKKTGMAHHNYYQWRKKGFIPIKTQLRLEKLSEGKLKANLDHLNYGSLEKIK